MKAYSYSLLIDATMLECSGIGTYLRQLLPLLARSADTKKIAVACHREHAEYLLQMGFTPIVWEVSLYGIARLLSAGRKLPSAHTLWFPHFNVPLLLPAHQRLITTIHDLFHLDCPQWLPFTHRLYSRLLISHAVRRSSVILTVSQATSNRILHFFPTAAHRVRVIHNGAPEYQADPSETPSEKRPFILLVGNVKPHKNIRGAITAFRQFRIRHPDYELEIAGKMDHFLNGEKGLNQELSASEGVHFRGFVTDEELSSLYRNCACYFFPSFYEGFGLPLLEAAAHGAKLCCSDIPSLREIGNGMAEFCQPDSPDDMAAALERAIFAPSADTNRIRRLLSRFSWNASSEAHKKVLIDEQ